MSEPPSESQPEPTAPTPTGRWADRHLWQIQPVRDVLVIAAIVGLVWLGYKLSIVTVPLLLAITLAYLFEPVIVWLAKREWLSRQGAAAAIIGATVLLIVVPVAIGTTFAVVQGVQLAGRIAETATNVQLAVENPEDEALQRRVDGGLAGWLRDELIEARRRGTEDALPPTEMLYPPTPLAEDAQRPAARKRTSLSDAVQLSLTWIENNAQAVTQRAFQTGASAFDAFVNTASSIVYLFFTLFLTAFFFFFISSGYGGVLEFGNKLIPDAHRELTVDLLRKFDAVISGFIRGRLTIAFIQSIVFSIGYWFIGVPAPVLLGVAVAILSIVPYAALIGIPISIALLWFEPHTGFRGTIWWTLAAPVAFYFIGQALDDYVWTPLIQGKSTGMDTPTILFATLAGGALMGVYGLLLAIPLAACIKILLQELFWPRFKEWTSGRRRDFLPISRT